MNTGHARGKALVLSHRDVARGYREMQLSWDKNDGPEIVPRPGQFFTLLPVHYPSPLLRRPFAYSAADKRGFSFIYEVRGPATRNFAEASTGDEMDWIGPLGSTFPDPPGDDRPVLIAGGIGLGPIYFWACDLAEAGRRPLVVLGSRNKTLVPELDWPDNVELRICTDDGSEGRRGSAMAGLDPEDADNAAFYTCGPHPMMEAVHREALKKGRPCWVSLEEMMACGVGACQGCAVPMADESYQRACVEGPIFDSGDVAW